MYLEKIYYLGKYREVARYYPGNYGAPGCKRRARHKPTPEDVAEQNKRNRERYIQRLILANFSEGDWWLTLTYRKEERPGSIEEAVDDRRKLIKRLQKEYREAGYEFKCLAATEIGKRGAVHHHFAIEDIANGNLNTKKTVMKAWKRGRIDFTPLYEDGEYKNLAEYMIKREGKEGQKQSYTRTRNLIIPQPQKRKVYRKGWEKEPGAEEGWGIIKDTLVNGINPATGLPHQRYMMRSLGKEGASADGANQDIGGKFMEKPCKEGWGSHVARRVQKAWGTKDQGRIYPPGSGNGSARNADGPGKRILHPEKAVHSEDEPGMRACVKRCVQRMASTVEGKRMEKRQRASGKKCRTLENVHGKSRTARIRGRKRHP